MQNFNNVDLSKEDIEKKKWLFKESIRIENEKKEIADAKKAIEIANTILQKQQSKNRLLKKQLENQKNLFDKQWQILEIETRKLVSDQEKFERDKFIFRDKVYREARKDSIQKVDSKIFFRGVTNITTLKKRYKDLLKIYHPDNMNGDHFVLLLINAEYEKLSKSYSIKDQ